MNQKGWITMSVEMIEAVEKVRKGFGMGSRVSVTALGRSANWRKDLNENLAMEVVDRNVTTAVLLKPEVYQAIMGRLEQLEIELEQSQIEALFQSRENMNNWATGEELVTKANDNFDSRMKYLRGKLNNGDNQ